MRIGIYGGSFNPIHRGHTRLAESLVQQGLVDEVWLMVSPLNPLKQGERGEIASFCHRLRMAELATEGVRGVRASDFEGRLPVPSYTIHTLEALERAYPGQEFTLVVGADNWLRFDHWYKSDEIRRRYPILVYRRPGYQVDVETVNTPLFDISSTQLRQAIRNGGDTGEWLNPRVAEYIANHNLYT